MNMEDDILIVDDEISNLRLLTELLEKDGYQVRPTDKAQTAIEAALAKPPSLILLDVRMPEIDGFEVCRRLKQDEGTQHVPIIFVSALQDVEARVQGFEAGGVDFITKPFQELEILARVKTHMALHRTQQNLKQLVDERTTELSKSREFNRAVLMSMTDHIAVLDKQGYILSVNTSWLDFARENDVSSLELIGEGINYLDVCRRASNDSDETAQRALRGIKGILGGSKAYFDLEYPCHSPIKQRWFYMRAIPFKGEKGGAVVAHSNISARKKAENGLRKAEQKYRTVADFTYDWEYWEAPDGRLLYVSPSCERITGHRPSDFVEHPELIEAIIQSEDLAVWNAHGHGAKTDSQSSRCQFRIRSKDGTTRWVEHVCQSVYDEQGNYAGLRASNREITELKCAEQEAREYRETLAQLDRTARLGQLTGSIAHELNQPLTGILSSAQAGEMLLEQGNTNEIEIKEILGDVIADAKRSAEIIRNVRNLFGGQKTEFKLLDPNAQIKETLRLLNSEFVNHSIAIDTDLCRGLPTVMANGIQFQQVLINLISNAIQAMQQSPKEKRSISIITAKGNGSDIQINMEDSGPGIDPEQLEAIFKPLATSKPGGLGMGLSISHSIVKAHGGRIWAENKPSGGARISFTLPAAEKKS